MATEQSIEVRIDVVSLPTDRQVASAVKRALNDLPVKSPGFICALCGEAFGRIHMCREVDRASDPHWGLPSLPHVEPADRRIIQWMPVEYMEAARAAQGMPDAHEAKLEPECGAWLVSPSCLPRRLREGPENGKGKARTRTRTMVYDFEEVP